MKRRERGSLLSHTLPPMVMGKLCGTLTVNIYDVVWCIKPPDRIAVVVKWWGEKNITMFRPLAEEATSKVEDSNRIIVTYKIRTSLHKFQSYLKDCESLILNVIDESVNISIGTVKISDLLNIVTEASQHGRYYPIINSSNNKVGDLCVKFILWFCQPDLQTAENTSILVCESNTSSSVSELKPVFERSNPLQEKPCKSQPFCEKNKTPLLKHVKRSNVKDFQNSENVSSSYDLTLPQLLQNSKKLKDDMINAVLEDGSDVFSDNVLMSSEGSDTSHVSSDVKILDFLLGKDMKPSEEHFVLQKFNNMSLDDSLLEIVENLNNTKNNESVDVPVVEDTNTVSKNIMAGSSYDADNNKSRFINYLKITIHNLVLSENENKGRIKYPSSVTYYVEYVLNSKDARNSSKCSQPYFQKSRKACSRKKIKNVIHFGKVFTDTLPSSDNGNNNIEVIFKISSRTLNDKVPTKLGIAKFCIEPVLLTEPCSYEKNLDVIPEAPVKHNIVLGSLKVNLQFGYNEISFDEIVTKQSREPYKIISNDMKNSSSELQNEAIKPEEKECNDEPHISNTTQAALLEKGSYFNPTCIIDSIRMPVLLNTLFYISEGHLLEPMSSYLVCRSFWKEDVIRSEVCWDTDRPRYSFHKVLPVLLNRNLLERSRNNYLITELWQCKSMRDDTLIGLCKHSLHEFYIAYKDPMVASQVILGKHPVIGVDGWTEVLNPFTRLSVGKLRIILALGTEDQIHLLEMSKGIIEDIYKSQTSVEYIPLDDNSKHSLQSLDNFNPVTLDTKISQDEIVDSQELLGSQTSDNTSDFEQVCGSMAREKHDKILLNGFEKSESNIMNHISVREPFCGDVNDVVNVVHSSAQTEHIEFTCSGNNDGNHKTVKSQCSQCNVHKIHFTCCRCTHKNISQNTCSSNANIFCSCYKFPPCANNLCCHSISTNPQFLCNSVNVNKCCNSEKHAQVTSNELCTVSNTLRKDASDESENILKNKMSHGVKDSLMINNEQSHQETTLNDIEAKLLLLDLSKLPSCKFIENGSEHLQTILPVSDICKSLRSNQNCDLCANGTIDDSKTQQQNLDRMQRNNNCNKHSEKSTPDDERVRKTNYISRQEENTTQVSSTSNITKDYIRTHVEIENSVDLSVDMHLISERSKMYLSLRIDDIERHNETYVSHMVPYDVNVRWNWKSDVCFPTYFFTEDHKRVIFRLWHTVNDVPDQIVDTVVGFIAVDLSVLSYGFQVISGWFHILDFTNSIRGQIKMNIFPLESLERFSAKSTCYLTEQSSTINPHQTFNHTIKILDFNEESVRSSLSRYKLKELEDVKDKIEKKLKCGIHHVPNQFYINSIPKLAENYVQRTPNCDVQENSNASEYTSVPRSTSCNNNKNSKSCQTNVETETNRIHIDPVIESAVQEMDWDSVFNPLLFQPLINSLENLHINAQYNSGTKSSVYSGNYFEQPVLPAGTLHSNCEAVSADALTHDYCRSVQRVTHGGELMHSESQCLLDLDSEDDRHSQKSNELVEEQCDSDSIISRQAPDGGNPVPSLNHSNIVSESSNEDINSTLLQEKYDGSPSDAINWMEVERIAKVLNMKIS